MNDMGCKTQRGASPDGISDLGLADWHILVLRFQNFSFLFLVPD